MTNFQENNNSYKSLNFENSIIDNLSNIYISPLETCNLHCKYCYTPKTIQTLSNHQILSFIDHYNKYLKKISLACPSGRRVKGRYGEAERGLFLKSILFCGGEVFTLKNFPDLINQLTSQNIFCSIITNGTIDRLETLKNPNMIQLLVSFDGPKDVHDRNRGSGNFDLSTNFIKKAKKLRFHCEIMYLVSPESYPFIDTFSLNNIPINYITIKSCFYKNDSVPKLTSQQIVNIKKNYHSIPAKNFGCFQLSLQSDGHIYGCCESTKKIGHISDPIEKIINNFKESLGPCSKCKLLKKTCHGCSDPEFLCHYKRDLKVTNCQQVVELFNHE